MNNTKTLEVLEQHKLDASTLLVQSTVKTAPNEAQELKDKLQKYGIKNQTRQFIDTKLKELNNKNAEVKKEQANSLFLNMLVQGLLGYKVVTYKTLNDVCNDYKLVMSALSRYEKNIPEDILPSLDIFVEKLAENKDLFKNKAKFQVNLKPTYLRGSYNKVLNNENHYYDEELSLEDMFKIAAPQSHFDKKSYNHKIGNELVNIDKPKSTEKLSWNGKFPEAKDPILFMPFLLLDKVYCIIVDAWDEEGDDTRIRNLF